MPKFEIGRYTPPTMGCTGESAILEEILWSFVEIKSTFVVRHLKSEFQVKQASRGHRWVNLDIQNVEQGGQ